MTFFPLLVGALTLSLPWDSRIQHALGPDSLTLHARVVLPDTSLRWVLHLPPARFDPILRVNGQIVHLPGDDFLPRKVEITPYVHAGENTLELTLHSWTSRLLEPPAWLRREKDWIRVRWRVKDQALAPIGGRFHQFGLYGQAHLAGYPGPYVQDVEVWTFFPDSLVVEVELSDPAPVRGRIRDSVQTFWTFRGKGKHLRWTWIHPDLERWWLDTPRLYALEIFAPGETARVAVGWRGFEARDGAFWLNGQKVFLCGTSFWPPWPPEKYLDPAYIRKTLLRIRNLNARIFRTHTQPWDTLWYALADSLGVLMIPEGALFNDDELYRLDDPRFDQAVRRHHEAMIRTLGHHPSVVMWSLGNELWGPRSKAPKYERLLGSWLDHARRVDPTRPVFFEADGDPAGKSDVIGIHYPLEFREYQIWPFAVFFLDRPIPVRHWFWPNRTFFWDRKKPLYIGEFLWMPSPTPHPYVPIVGDDAFRPLGWAEAKGRAWTWQILAYRHFRVSGFTPWSVQDRGLSILDDTPVYLAQQDACKPTRTAFRRFRRSAPEGFLDDTLEVFHDDFAGQSFRLVISGNNRTFLDTTLDLPPFSHLDLPLRFFLPPGRTLRRETLRVVLYDGKDVVDVRTLPVDVFSVPGSEGQDNDRSRILRIDGASPWGTFYDRPAALLHPWSPHPLLDLFPEDFMSLWGKEGLSARGMVDPPPSPYVLPLWGAGDLRGMKAVVLLEAGRDGPVVWHTLNDTTPEGRIWLARMREALDTLHLPEGLTVWPDLGDLRGVISLPYPGRTAWWLRPHPRRLQKIKELVPHVRRGGRVLVERPTQEEARFLGLEVTPAETTVRRSDHPLARWVLREHLMSYGTPTVYWRDAPPQPVTHGILQGGLPLTDPPAVAVVPQGKGFWVVSTLKSPTDVPVLQQAYLDILRMMVWMPQKP